MSNSNSDFDINILENALTLPNIPVTFPLPTDQETYVPFDGNAKLLSNTFSLLSNFFNIFTNVEFDDIYRDNEFKYSINKYSPEFVTKFRSYMNDKLENLDERLNQLVQQLVDQELNLKLISAKDFNKRFTQVKLFMVKYYKQENEKNMPTFGSHNIVRMCYITVMTVFQKMFPQGIYCKNSDFQRLFQQYIKDPHSIIFLPNHQSHIDYIIIHLLAVRFQFSVPAVIAGENLNVAVFGKILKDLGAIYIPRSFNNDLYTEHNLNNAIEFLLLNNIHFEVFIEGTRSRDGKLLLPKYGILKTMANLYMKQHYIDKNDSFDLYYQPMNITYERIYETDGYLKELIGDDKKQESFINIFSNGVSNLVGSKHKSDEVVLDSNGFINNYDKQLSGKIFLKLGEMFTMKEFIENDNDKEITAKMTDFSDAVNLKKLGFKILHEINRISYLPKISLIGFSLQIHYYFYKSRVIDIKELLPTFKLVLETFHPEANTPTNETILKLIMSLNDQELISMIKTEIVKFFKYVKVNPATDQIKIENPVELIYYKNLSIHTVIQRCMISFVLVMLKSNCNYNIINKLVYILTGLMKNEFLFDYNYNPRDELTFILNDMVEKNLIRLNGSEYEIVDSHQINIFSNLVKPFLESYIHLISNIFGIISSKQIEYKRLYAEHKNDVNFEVDEIKYPSTKELLKFIIFSLKNDSFSLTSREALNKQYLLSDLYYLNNLKLIKIFKNKSKTTAFVKVMNPRDLNVVLQFLKDIIAGIAVNDEVKLKYIIDIIDKNFEREIELRGKF